MSEKGRENIGSLTSIGRLAKYVSMPTALLLIALTVSSCNKDTENGYSENFPNETVETVGSVEKRRSEDKFALYHFNKKFSRDFDEIREIRRYNGLLYYIGKNNGEKPQIMNGRGDTISIGLDYDCIYNYTINNGNSLVSGKKDGNSYLSYNKEILDECHSYWIYDSPQNNGAYAISIDDEKITFFVNGEKIGHNFTYKRAIDGNSSGSYEILDYGEGYVIITNEGSDSQPKRTLSFNGEIIGTDMEYLNKNIAKSTDIIFYIKDGKKYILGKDGKQYEVLEMEFFDKQFGVENCINCDADSFMLLVRNGADQYYFDGEFHKCK